MSEGSAPANADETRIARDPDRVSTLDPTATRVAAVPASPPPGFDPAATRIGAQDLLAPPRPLGSHEPVERFKVGDRIGDRYEVLAIHRGAMGVVYGTFDHELQLPRALKGVQDRFARDSRLRRAFAAEAAVWVRLEKHPFIARAYEVATFEGLPYVVAEYIRGREGRGPDLRSWVGDRSVGLEIAVEMALQIAQGMQHAVRRVPGLVHCDLKPANVLVNDRVQAMVTDFGLAAGGGLEGGTPAYMAPEQWRGEPPDVRTDIYAFGCVIYELFTRHRVFAARTEQEWSFSHLNERPYSPRAHRTDLPDELGAFVLGCLAKERDERPAGWDEVVGFCAQWFHNLTGQPAVLDFTAYALDAGELLNAGYSLSQLGGHQQEELGLYERALATESEDDGTTAILLVNMGITLGQLGRDEEAAQVYADVVARFADVSDAEVREQVAKACFNKGVTLGRLGRGEEAVLVYDDVVTRFADAPEAEVREHVAKAFVNKGVTLGQLGRGEEAVLVYDDVVARFAEASEASIRELVAKGFVFKGNSLGRLGRGEEAVRAYDEVTARFAEAPEAGIRELVVNALVYKGTTLGQLGRREEEVRVYDELVARFADAPEASVREQVTKAFFWKGSALGRLGRGEEAVLVYDDVAARFAEAPEADGRQQVARALVSKGFMLGQIGQGEEAVRVYDNVVARFADTPEPGIRELVANALLNKGTTLGKLGRGEEEVRTYDGLVGRFAGAQQAGIRELAGC